MADGGDWNWPLLTGDGTINIRPANDLQKIHIVINDINKKLADIERLLKELHSKWPV